MSTRHFERGPMADFLEKIATDPGIEDARSKSDPQGFRMPRPSPSICAARPPMSGYQLDPRVGLRVNDAFFLGEGRAHPGGIAAPTFSLMTNDATSRQRSRSTLSVHILFR